MTSFTSLLRPYPDSDEAFYDADYYGHAPDEDEIADLRRTLRVAGPNRAALIEARLSDAEMVAHSRDQKRYLREGGL